MTKCAISDDKLCSQISGQQAQFRFIHHQASRHRDGTLTINTLSNNKETISAYQQFSTFRSGLAKGEPQPGKIRSSWIFWSPPIGQTNPSPPTKSDQLNGKPLPGSRNVVVVPHQQQHARAVQRGVGQEPQPPFDRKLHHHVRGVDVEPRPVGSDYLELPLRNPAERDCHGLQDKLTANSLHKSNYLRQEKQGNSWKHHWKQPRKNPDHSKNDAADKERPKNFKLWQQDAVANLERLHPSLLRSFQRRGDSLHEGEILWPGSRTFPDPQGTSIWGPRSLRRAWWWSSAVPWRSPSSSSSSTSPWRRLSFGSQFSSTSLLSDAPEISDSSRLTSRTFRMLSSAICLCLRCLSTLKSKFYFFFCLLPPSTKRQFIDVAKITSEYQTSINWRSLNLRFIGHL